MYVFLIIKTKTKNKLMCLDMLNTPPTTTTPTTAEGRFSCRKKSRFYIANPNYKPSSSALLEENLSERPCQHNAAQCVVYVKF